MKFFLRFFLGPALALLATVAAHAAPVMVPAGVSAASAGPSPGDTITVTVTATNAGAATPADDMAAGGTITGTVIFTHKVTGHTITTGSVAFTTTATVAGDGGSGTFTRTFTVPTITSQAGIYDASVTLTAASSGTASGSFTSTSVMTVTGTPDLAITGLTYPAGTAYRGGDVIPFTLSYTNRTSTNGTYNVPYVSSTNGNASYFRIEIILSSNPTFGDADDFLLTSHDRSFSYNSGTQSGDLRADGNPTTITWNQILPGNFAGTYYVMAKIDTLSGVTETVESDLTDNGNNIYYSPDNNAARISLLPTNFPTTYWASTSGNGYSDNPSVSSDGRYTAFASDSTTLGTGDTNSVRDIFLYDNQTSTVRRLSLSQQGSESNGASNNPAISANGTYVAFSSDATNLALDDTNGFSDIYVVNALTGVVTRVSLSTAGVAANGSNFKPAISATGRYIAWESNATNLIVAGTTVGVTNIYLRDRDVSGSGTFDTANNVSTVLVSQSTGGTAGNGNSIQVSISGGGRYIAFASDATNLVAGDTNALRDIFVRDVTGGTTTRVSVATGGTEATGGASRAPSINQNNGSADDGRYIAFGSEATNLVAGDTNAVSDIFVHDRTGVTTSRVSVSSAGVEATDPSSTSDQKIGSVNPSISSTGRYVAFASLASNLTGGDLVGREPSPNNDSNAAVDVFVMDRDVSGSGTFDTGGNIATTMVSKNRFGYQTSGLLGTPSTAASDLYPAISANGRWVAFPSDAENTGGLVHSATNRSSPDLNTFRDIFLHDRRINALPSATTPPSVTISSPVTGTSYPVNSSLTLIGSATAPAGTIASVQFFVNGTSLGTDTSFPYNATWTPTAVGSFALSALVTDSFGNQATSANVSITIAAVSPTSPTVSITSPSTASTTSVFVNAATTVSATATDPDGTIASVAFYANNVLIGTDTSFPYSVTFTPTATGTYLLTAVATDNGGNQYTTTTAASQTATISVTSLAAPTISVSSATPVQINSATTITATTTTLGSIASVQFLANGTILGTVTAAPFTFSWTPTAAGSYTLTGIATDNLGTQTTSANFPVTVNAGSAVPVFLPLAPSILGATAPITVSVNTAQTITAAATDADGTVVSIQFFVNGASIGTATTFPFTASWTPTTAGTYTLQAVATDNLGNETTSSATTVTVASGTAPSSVSVTAPATLAVGTTASLTATATANTGTIANVQFLVNSVPLSTDTTFPYTASFTPLALGTYTITAIATDSVGNRTTSAAATMTVAANAAPTGVAITAPTAAANINVGTATTLTATATDADGSIAGVQFFANGVSAGTVTTSPYTLSWTPGLAGTYSLTAVATDNLGLTTTSPAVSVTAGGTNAPTGVSISAPVAGSRAVGSAITIDASATAAVGTIASMQFFANGVSLGIDTTFPYSATWTPLATGSYTLTAVATDTSGNSATSSGVAMTVAPNSSPSVAISAPAAGANVNVSVATTVTATASDTDGTVVNVQFFANGAAVGTVATSPYTISWTPGLAGTYSLTAVATDNLGAITTSAAVSVTAGGTNAPTGVSISAPTAGSRAVGSVITIDAVATATVGTIASMQFFANGVALGTDTTFPYSTTWAPTAIGSYSLTAIATDTSGNSSTSAPVTMTIAANVAPTLVTIGSPTNLSSVNVGVPTTISASATDGDGSIVAIQFFANGALVGSDTTSPYTVAWTPGLAGSYSLTAVATDNLGATTTSPVVSVTAGGANSPSASLTAPSTLSRPVGSTIAVTATANANVGAIANVQFFATLGGVSLSLGTDTTLPYTATWTPTSAGTYILTAIATDTVGNAATSSSVTVIIAPTNTAPSAFSLTTPLNLANVAVGSANSVTASPSDSDGTIASVQFFAQKTSVSGSTNLSLGTVTTAPYAVTWTPTTAGTYSLTAVATDDLGATRTSDVTIVTVAGGDPDITLASPGATVLVNSINNLTATATAATGTIASVQFFANGVSLGTDTTFPYAATWTPVATGTYSLTALATDTSGNQKTSIAVSVTVATNTAPTVNITAPVNLASVGVGTANTIAATAADTDGTVASVQFFANGVSIGTDTTFPYTAAWTPTVAGNYALTAVATDNLGLVTTSPTITVTVTNGTAPTVAISSPAALATIAVNSANTIAATATATATGATVANVQFFVNGVALGAADTAFPYSAAWTPTAVGTYSLTATVVDSAGNQATSSAVTVTVAANQLPTVSISAPANAASVVAGSVNSVAATAADADGNVVNVQFFANGVSLGTDTTFPYTATWTPTVAGTYAITAVAIDNVGGTTTSGTNTVTVTNGTAPTVLVTAPTNGSALAVNTTNTVTATAAATLSGATIASVQFFANGVSLGSDTVFPYSATWTPTALGTYAITALATDSSGNQSTSTANSVTVSTAGAGPAPTVSLTSPNSGATYVVGQPVTMGATVGLGSSFITGVQFFVNGISIGGGSTPPNGQGSAPFWTASWTPAAPGSYTFTAVVTDANGVQVTSAPIGITVSAVTVPTILIASPSNATSLAPNLPQTLVATVGVTNAAVQSVQFFANNISLGTVTTHPYSVNWTPATTGDYSVIAVLTTSTGVAVTSAPVVYSVASGTVPTVSVTSPASVNVGFPQNVVATAVATQSGAVIREVQFFVNGVSIGTDATFPFGATWTPLVPSTVGNPYILTAVATDTLGNRQTSTAVAVTATAVSTTAPSVNIVTPANASTVSIGTSPAPVVTITAKATDPDGTIVSVQFLANGVSLGTITAFPYTISWTPTAEGTYSLTAVAIDDGGNRSTSPAIVVTAAAAGAPTVSLTTSAAGNASTTNTPVTLTALANATGFNRTISSVQFYQNGNAIGAPDTASPFTTTWTPTVPGVYVITAVALDDLSISGSSAATNITVTSGTPPTVRVTSPGNNATVAASTLQTFTATATPGSALIANVQFLINGASIGNDSSFPYSVTYTPASLGAYALTAIATDAAGNTTTSSAVNFTAVAAVGPVTVVTAPTVGASGSVGTAVTVSATATTSSGTITSVQFFANGVSIGTDTTAPYGVTWIPTAGGPVNLTAVATDSSNVTGALSAAVTYTVLTPPATVSITGPGAGATLPVNVPQTIFASATVANGTVVSVQFFVNGVALASDSTFPYSAPWTPATTGTFALTAKATDNFGTVTDSAITTGVVTVTVTGGTAPSVSLSSPANNSTISVGLPQVLVANATAVNGTIASVRFLANNLSLGTDNTFPYNLTWTPTAVGTYEIKVVATDTLGNETTGTLTTITVAPISAGAPVVSLTAPAAGASLPVGVTTLLAATATDPDGTIVGVEFLSNGVTVATDTVFPYNASFTPGATGTYVLTAVATDNGGNITTSPAITVTVTGGTAPSIAIDGPANGVTLGVNIPQRITAAATSATGFIKDVQFFLNGQPLSSDSSYPYAADWNPTAIGTYTLTARATDNLGNITDSAPVVVTIGASAAPTVSVTNPPNGSSYTVGAVLNLTAEAADSDGTIAGVQFFVNGVAQGALDAIAPYTGTWTPGSVGVYTLTARATDNNGNVTTSAPVTVTIGANAAPTVALTSPAAGTYSLGNLVLVSAAANDSDGTVASVQFFANGLSIGTSTAAPFNASWRPTLAGTFRLTAVATDNAGNVTTSAVVSVTITSTAAPAVTITNPIVGQPYGVGNAIPFTANPSGGNGPIAQVQFFVNGTSVGTDTSSPYSSTFTPNAPGTYSLLAIATDSAGLSSSSSATINLVVTGNSAPVVSITSPPSGTSVNGGTIVNLTAIATDVDGTVASVRFLANGNQVGTPATSVPYGTTWIPSAAGTYTVTAQATDNSGNVTNSAPISVSVVANAVPTVALTSPSNGATVRVGSGATLAATASDPDGTIASVQFFANGLSIGTDTSSPYSAQWTPAAEGVYRVTAVALDNSGAATTSGTILVLSVSAASGGTDTVYAGSYSGSGENGRFATINIRGKSAAFIGFSQTSPVKIYYFDSLPVDLSGGFFLADSLGRAVLSGSVSDTGVSGSLDAGRVNFIAPVTFPSTTATIASGFYTGNLTDRTGSLLAAIVGSDGSLFVYVTDGAAFRDAGSGAVNSTGAFSITTATGNRLVGRADPATGFLTGTLTGGPGGTFTAALASGVSFSDGFLRNLSTRGPVGAGGDVLVAGFAVSGSTPKRVLVRAIGPTLAAFGLTGALADTRLDLFSGNTLVVANDNWGGAGDVIAATTSVGAFPLAPTSLDSVVVATLPPGLYTAQVSGVGGRTGVALVELYDLDSLQAFSTQKLTNVATKATLTAAQNQIIAGFMVSGSTAKKVLIRAVGPTLGRAPFNVPGTLADPNLRLVRGDGTVVRENDNWEVGNDAALIGEASAKVGAFALAAGAKDGAILLNLPPGTYSAQVSGAAPGTGVVLIEVYEVP